MDTHKAIQHEMLINSIKTIDTGAIQRMFKGMAA
jgi:hypothetical protein